MQYLPHVTNSTSANKKNNSTATNKNNTVHGDTNIQSEKSSSLVAGCFVSESRFVRARALQVDLNDGVVLEVQRHVRVEQRVVVTPPHVKQYLPHCTAQHVWNPVLAARVADGVFVERSALLKQVLDVRGVRVDG